MLHTAYNTVPTADIDFVLEVGGATRTGTCRPINDPPFGGDAGAALQGDISLDVIGDVTDGTATP
jgi:hypothetical protein